MSDFAGAGALLEEAVMVSRARCRLAAAGFKSPAAGNLSPPPSVGLSGCLCETRCTQRVGDVHAAVSSLRLLPCTLV